MSYTVIEQSIDQVEAMTSKIYTDYAELADRIQQLLGLQITKEDIVDYYENYYCCEQEDLKIQSRFLHLL